MAKKPEVVNTTSGFAPGVEQAVFGGGGGGAPGAANPYASGYTRPGIAGAMARWMGSQWQANNANAGVSPLRGEAVQAGLRGIGAPGALDSFLNPYLDQVVGGVQGDFDRLRQQASARTGSEATAQGAGFGGRRAVLEAERLRNLDQLEGQQLGQLRFGGFQSAQQMALQDLLHRSQLGLAGLPTSQTSTVTGGGNKANPLLTALGGAGTGFAAGGGPIGAVIGGLGGLLGGLFD